MSEAVDIKRKQQDYQTPPDVCKYMASLIPAGCRTILEPTPGIGNIVRELRGYDVTAPKDFFKLDKELFFDCIVMNPPFSCKYAYGIPESFNKLGMRLGYHILLECMQKSNNIIALMPWFTISDSDVRLRTLKLFGIKSITALPRKTFQFARIQTCVFQFEKNYPGETSFKVFDLFDYKPMPKLL